MKIQLLDIFKDHNILAKASIMALGYDEWLLSIARWITFYNSHGKYKRELNEYFHMYQFQLNFAMACATSTLDISWQHLNHPNLLVCSVYILHVYFHLGLILHDLDVSLPHENSFSKVNSSYIERAYYSICDDYGVNPHETWVHGAGFIRQTMVILALRKRIKKGLHQRILHDG